MPKEAEVSADKKYRIIELVHPHPQIWDKAHEKYLDSIAKKELFQTIGGDARVQLSADEVSKQWGLLRDGYLRARKTAKVPSGAAAADVEPTSKWQFFRECSFLKKNCEGRNTQSFLSASSTAGSSSSSIPVDSVWNVEYNPYATQADLFASQGTSDNLMATLDPEQQLHPMPKENMLAPQTAKAKAIKRRASRPDDPLEAVCKATLLSLNKKMNELSKPASGDDTYGLLIASELNGWSPLLRAQAKSEIDSVLNKYRILAAQEAMYGTPQYSTYGGSTSGGSTACQSPSSTSQMYGDAMNYLNE